MATVIPPAGAGMVIGFPAPPASSLYTYIYCRPYIHCRRFDPRRLWMTHLHYCQRTTASENWFLRPAGYDLETDRKRDKWLNGKALIRKSKRVRSNSLMPRWEAGISLNPVQMA